jgi:bifunctional non-homologous end joining protein LigD
MKCAICRDTGWVCEDDADRPWAGSQACDCGGAGMPCPACNPCDEGSPPRPPEGYPRIVEAALKNRSSSFVIDGEAVLLGVDGISDFDGLHSREHDDEVELYAFDALMVDGDDLRKLPLSMRKTNLARLLALRTDGIFVAQFEEGEIGPGLFRAACRFGLEGLVSKHRDSGYRAGTSPNWVKVKNPKHPAMNRVKESFK